MNKRLFSLMLVLALMLGLGSMASAANMPTATVTVEKASSAALTAETHGLAVEKDGFFVKVTTDAADLGTNFTIEDVAVFDSEDAEITPVPSGLIGSFVAGKDSFAGSYLALIDQTKIVEGTYKVSVTLKAKDGGYDNNGSPTKSAGVKFGTKAAGAGEAQTAVPGFDVDIEALEIEYKGNGTLYYRVGSATEIKKDGKWTKADAKKVKLAANAEGTSVFAADKILTKAATIEFAIGTDSAGPGNKDTGTTVIKVAAQKETPKDKPKAIDYSFSKDGFWFAKIEKVSADMYFKLATSKEYQAVYSGSESVKAYTGTDGKLVAFYVKTVDAAYPGAEAGYFYYRAGLTSTELNFVLPSVDQANNNGVYQAASKILKCKVAGEQKLATMKINYTKNILGVKDGQFEVYDKNASKWMPLSKDSNAPYKYEDEKKGVEITDTLWNNVSYTSNYAGATLKYMVVRLAGNLKKAGTAPYIVYIYDKAVIDTDNIGNYITVDAKGKKVIAISGSYAIEHYATDKWKKGGPALVDGKLTTATPIRIAAGFSYAASDSVNITYDGKDFAVGSTAVKEKAATPNASFDEPPATDKTIKLKDLVASTDYEWCIGTADWDNANTFSTGASETIKTITDEAFANNVKLNIRVAAAGDKDASDAQVLTIATANIGTGT